MKQIIMNKVKFFESIQIFVNAIGAYAIGSFAAMYDWRIALILIPYVFFVTFAIIFKNKIKGK